MSSNPPPRKSRLKRFGDGIKRRYNRVRDAVSTSRPSSPQPPGPNTTSPPSQHPTTSLGPNTQHFQQPAAQPEASAARSGTDTVLPSQSSNGPNTATSDPSTQSSFASVGSNAVYQAAAQAPTQASPQSIGPNIPDRLHQAQASSNLSGTHIPTGPQEPSGLASPPVSSSMPGADTISSHPSTQQPTTSSGSKSTNKVKEGLGVALNGLETVLRVLEKSADACPPLKSAVGGLVACLDVIQVSYGH